MFAKNSSPLDFTVAAFDATENNATARVAFLNALTLHAQEKLDQVEEALIVKLPKIMGARENAPLRDAATRALNAFLGIPYHLMNEAWALNVVEVGSAYGRDIHDVHAAIDRLVSERPDLVDPNLLEHAAQAGPATHDKYDRESAEYVLGALLKKPLSAADDVWAALVTRLSATDEWSEKKETTKALQRLLDERPDLAEDVLRSLKLVAATDGYGTVAIQRTLGVLLKDHADIVDIDMLDKTASFASSESVERSVRELAQKNIDLVSSQKDSLHANLAWAAKISDKPTNRAS